MLQQLKLPETFHESLHDESGSTRIDPRPRLSPRLPMTWPTLAAAVGSPD
jgi:hypothetical protein